MRYCGFRTNNNVVTRPAVCLKQAPRGRCHKESIMPVLRQRVLLAPEPGYSTTMLTQKL